MQPRSTRNRLAWALRLLVLGAAAAIALGAVAGARGVRTSTGPTGRIAVVGDGGLYVVRTRTGRKRMLDFALMSSPSWSPDGRRIAYVAHGRLLVRSAVTGRVHAVAGLRGRFTEGAAWSPRGDRLAFVLHTATGLDPRLVVVGSDGRGRRVLVRHVAAFQLPRWAPGGRWVAYLAEGPDGSSTVCAVRPDGRGRHVVGERASGYGTGASWSPDGRRLAYVGGGADGEGSAVVIARADGSHARAVAVAGATGDQASLDSVTWAPRGSRIAYLRLSADGSGAHTSWELVVTVPGGDARVIARAPYIDELAWSPDGRWLAYLVDTARQGEAPAMAIRLVSAGGTRSYRLTGLGPEAFGIDWAADPPPRARVTAPRG